jgi:Fe-S oxidoreductase
MSATPAVTAEGHPTTDDCRYCWMCRHVCPVGHVTRRETLTPHAWAMLIASVERGSMEWTPDAVDVLYACADCGACQTHCVTDRPLPAAITEARARVMSAGSAPPPVRTLVDRLARWGNAYVDQEPARTTATGATALFVGDAAHHLAPGSVEAARRLLAAAGVPVVPVGVGRSSGLLASTLGARDTAAALARTTIDEITAVGAREVLVLCAEDAYAFSCVYPDRLDVPWPADLALREVSEVLLEAAASGALAFEAPASPAPYTWLDSPQAARAGRGTSVQTTLLQRALGQAPAGALFWRGERAHPAGNIGGLAFTHPDIAARLSDARLADAAAAGAAWLVSDDPAALHHLAGRQAEGVAVRNLYELLADAQVPSS